mgnify:FL=1
MNEGRGYVIGNLVREWERKEVTVKGTKKTLWKNCVAHQPHKNDDTVFVEVTVWPYEQDDTLGRTLSDATEKGKPVAAYGSLKQRHYDGKDGTKKSQWQMDVFRMASEIRKPYNPGQQSSSNEQVTFASGATYPAADMEPF